MKLLVTPADGIAPLLKGIDRAKKSIAILIFRFDQKQIEEALVQAVKRGVSIRALIANINRGGEKYLRQLETRLLAAGITVARTANEFVRYHGKLMVVDERDLYLLAFNFTNLDINRSRSFGIITKNRKRVKEALKLFDADMKRQPYTAGLDDFLVSPVNARKQLEAFLKGAKKQLLIYDPKVSDAAMIRVLRERAEAGVEIRILGELTRKIASVEARKLSHMRLHARVVLRDQTYCFLGSQSLRTAELDTRREVGMIFRESAVTSSIAKIFEEDWEATKREEKVPLEKMAKRVAKAVAKEMPAIHAVMAQAAKEAGAGKLGASIDHEKADDAVKEAVRSAVKDMLEEAAVSEAAESK